MLQMGRDSIQKPTHRSKVNTLVLFGLSLGLAQVWFEGRSIAQPAVSDLPPISLEEDLNLPPDTLVAPSGGEPTNVSVSSEPSLNPSKVSVSSEPSPIPSKTLTTPNPFAQAAIEAEEDERILNSRPRRFLNLTLGVEQDEPLDRMPPSFSFKGSFSRIVDVSFVRDLNVLRFRPRREGQATLTIHDSRGRKVADYRIEVRQSNLDKVMRQIQALLADIEGIQIKIINNKVVVDGLVLLPRDIQRIHNVVSQYGDLATYIVNLSPLAQRKIAEFISRDINNPEIEVRAVNDKIVLQGFANSEDEKNRAEVIAKLYVQPLYLDRAVADQIIRIPRAQNDGVVNLIQIKPGSPPPPPKIIQIVVHYVELSKDYNRLFRFNFSPGIKDETNVTFQSGGGGGGVTSTIAGTINNLLPQLNWAKEHGFARVLESSSMIVQDNEQGTIRNVQKVPFVTAVGPSATPTTNFLDVGTQINITPSVQGERSDSVQMTIAIEISALSGTAGGAPLSTQTQVNTKVAVRSGQSAALGGIIKNQSITGFNKLPRNTENPIITLFASRNFQRNQSQFVVFITPIIKSSASQGAERIKEKFRLRD
jgi:pilus assembly protein CpaC